MSSDINFAIESVTHVSDNCNIRGNGSFDSEGDVDIKNSFQFYSAFGSISYDMRSIANGKFHFNNQEIDNGITMLKASKVIRLYTIDTHFAFERTSCNKISRIGVMINS